MRYWVAILLLYFIVAVAGGRRTMSFECRLRRWELRLKKASYLSGIGTEDEGPIHTVLSHHQDEHFGIDGNRHSHRRGIVVSKTLLCLHFAFAFAFAFALKRYAFVINIELGAKA